MSTTPSRLGNDEDERSSRRNRANRRRSIDGGGLGRLSDHGKSGRLVRGHTSGGALSSEDEIRRIREQRNNRRRALLEGGGDNESHDDPEAEERRRRENRERRRQLREEKARGEITPSKHRSTPLMTRRALTEAGLLRNDRVRRGDQSPSRVRSNQTTEEERTVLSRSRRGNEDDGSTFSRRSRTNRNERSTEEEEDITTRIENRRARRLAQEAEAGNDDGDDDNRTESSLDRLRRERRRSIGSLRNTQDNNDSAFENEDGADQSRRIATDREARRRHRLSSELRSTDLTTLLRKRREARANERENAISRRGLDVERSVTRRRSGDEILAQMALQSSKKKEEENAVRLELEKLSEDLADLQLESHDGQGIEAVPDFSVRINVISAVDLPQTVVANMPLCPIMKFGLVKNPTETIVDTSKVIAKKLGNNSIEKVPSARVRSTTSKILSKRDNGTVDFHQELRWDGVKEPAQVALYVELSAKAAKPCVHLNGSPPPLSQNRAFLVPVEESIADGMQSSLPTDENGDPMRGVTRASSGEGGGGGLRALWRNVTDRKAVELEAALNAQAMARKIIEQENAESDTQLADNGMSAPIMRLSMAPQSDYNVGLQDSSEAENDAELTEDVRLGRLVIPLKNLPLEKAMNKNEAARVEQWYQVESIDESNVELQGRQNKPRVLLEISLSPPETLDDSEDELEDDANEGILEPSRGLKANPSFGRRSVSGARSLLRDEKRVEETKIEDPVLEPGVIDFITVVGCRDIGNQKNDNGHQGWVNSTPDSVIFEQFPPDNEFHQKSGRNALLPEMVQWFCFPEGNKLWRGTSPPSYEALNLKRFSGSSPANMASSLDSFNACLNCTTSFSWFVIASNSDEYGSKLVKTYGAVIRFYVPAPTGVDPTQEDFTKSVVGESPLKDPVKRLWVPIGICITSNLPIIGVMEGILLRLCEGLMEKVGNTPEDPTKLEEIQKALMSLIINFQKPIAGAVNCSVPFLSGDSFLLSLPPPTGLPPLPHGRSVVSACRLLGAKGLNFLLAAVLTECKILIHSHDVANIAMVAEVVTALTYPFTWSLPYIPILPIGMLEFVEAPLSYMLGIPTCNLHLIDPHALEDVVVIDLNNEFLDTFEKKGQTRLDRKAPMPLPATVARNISKAWFKLVSTEEKIEEEFGLAMLADQALPRLEEESLAEREFRVTVAVEICSLLRGYDQCLGPVFNRDKFLKISPLLFEDRQESRGNALSSRAPTSKSVAPHSKRFLSLLVNTQNFQQLLESLESDEASLFYDIMDVFDDSASDEMPPGSRVDKREKALKHLSELLQNVEDKIPTYRVCESNFGEGGAVDDSFDIFSGLEHDGFQDFDVLGDEGTTMSSRDENIMPSFPETILAPIPFDTTDADASEKGTIVVSMEYIQTLETKPWEYRPFVKVPLDLHAETENSVDTKEKVKLRDAIGERQFLAWKMAQDKKIEGEVDLSFIPDSLGDNERASIDLTSLVTSATSDTSETASMSSSSSSLRTSTLTPEQQRVFDARNRDIIRRCLDRANVGNRENYSNANDDTGPSNPFLENGRDLMAEAEKALQHSSTQRFLLSILAQRSRLESQRARVMRRRQSSSSSVSRLDTVAFECLVRMSCAMLDSCMDYNEYETAYRLLTQTAGFIMVIQSNEEEDEALEAKTKAVVSVTSRIGMHPIFADLGLWQEVMSLHLRDQQSEKKTEAGANGLGDDESDEEEDEDEKLYEAAVGTLYEMLGYGIPALELCRFAMKVCQDHGWFSDDRGRQLLMLARRIGVRREQADLGGAGDSGDIDMIRGGQDGGSQPSPAQGETISSEGNDFKWVDIAWCHPAAPSSVLKPERNQANEFMKRSPVTALAVFDSSVVVTGGLDGSVFLAHSLPIEADMENNMPEVRGIHLDWGSASRASVGSTSDGEYGVGAVTCLAAAYGIGHHESMQSKKDTRDNLRQQDDLLAAMEGSRVVAGTTAGDLRVWSVKDIYSALELTKGKDTPDGFSNGNASTRLKFSLRGRALSGHRGCVTCIDVPSHLYRPDSLVTGGADGLIKLWSLRGHNGGRRSILSTQSPENESSGQHRGRGSDALSILQGHTGRIMCAQTAWHGDRLLSGGADRTVRIWDLAGSGGKCLHTLSGHFGWVTMVKYWGPNTIISASTDRSIALWDARVRSSPLFVLRHHQSPISDLLVGSRTDPMMASAAADGTIATWDFRALSGGSSKGYQMVRQPAATMKHGTVTGAVKLARGRENANASFQSFLSVGPDTILREWDMSTGTSLSESNTGHIDEITCFGSFAFGGEQQKMDREGTLTCSLDGSVRMRRWMKV